MDIYDLAENLKKGVPVIIDRWPGNDGEDRKPDIALAEFWMKEASDEIYRLSRDLWRAFQALEAIKIGDVDASEVASVALQGMISDF